MFIMKIFRELYLFCCLLLVGIVVHGQTFRDISGWDLETNQKLESFLNSTLIIKERKVAVFDCDGTLLGQTPYYLADEAIYSYAKNKFAGRNDSLSMAKMAIIKNLTKGNNVGVDYVKNRIGFLSGLSPEEIETIGQYYFHAKYQTKFYPEMRELLAILQDYDFEIWVLTASPEICE